MHNVECSGAVYLSRLFGTECICLKKKQNKLSNGSLNIDCH